MADTRVTTEAMADTKVTTEAMADTKVTTEAMADTSDSQRADRLQRKLDEQDALASKALAEAQQDCERLQLEVTEAVRAKDEAVRAKDEAEAKQLLLLEQSPDEFIRLVQKAIDGLSEPAKQKGLDAMRRVVYAESDPAGAVPPAEGVPVGRETCRAQARCAGERVSG